MNISCQQRQALGKLLSSLIELDLIDIIVFMAVTAEVDLHTILDDIYYSEEFNILIPKR